MRTHEVGVGVIEPETYTDSYDVAPMSRALLRARRRRSPRFRPSYQGALAVVDAMAPAILVVLFPSTWPVTAMFALVMMATFGWLGLYRRRFTESVLDDLPSLGLGVTAGAAPASLIASTISADASWWSVVAWTALVVLLGRWAVYASSRTGWLVGEQRVLVVGSGDVARRAVQGVMEQPPSRMEFVGCIELKEEFDPPRLGNSQALRRVLEQNLVDCVVIAAPRVPEGDIVRCIRHCMPLDVEFYTVPAGSSMRRWRGPQVDRIGFLTVLPLTGGAQGEMARRAKRLVDVALASAALIIALPALILTAAAVRLEGGPKVIFRQVRIGHGGVPFVLYKFRSLAASEAESQTRWTVVDDPRIGPVGRFIRATSLDELPQLINVLRGDMSLVGPRPERPHFVEQFQQAIPDYAHRHRVLGGLTGDAAVRGLRGDTSIESRALVDNLYIDNWSLWEDVKILARTLGVVAGRRGR